MTELKGPPCGFLGLGSSSGTSGNNGGGRDFDLVLRGNVDRYEVVDAAHDVSMSDEDRIPAINDSTEGNPKGPYKKYARQPARRGWSMETWSQIKLDVPPPEPFEFMFRKKPLKAVIHQAPLTVYSTPYTKSELLEILGMFPEAPPSAYEIKSAYESRMDIAAGKFKNEKDPARHTKGGPSMVIDENYLYSFGLAKGLGGPHRKERAETLKDLDELLVRITQANLQNDLLATLNRKLGEEAAVQKLRYEQAIRSVDGFNELIYLIKAYYNRVYDRVVRGLKHNDNPEYYHPADRLAKESRKESVRKQLITFTEVNVNSWAKNDDQDPTIVHSNKGLRFLANDDPDLPFDKRRELKFPGAAPRAVQSGFVKLEDARLSVVRRHTISKKSNEDWEAYLESQIAALGEEYLEGGEIPVAFNNRVSKLLFKLKDDPEERTNALFQNNRVKKIKKLEFDRVVHTIKVHLKNERDTPGSSYCRLLELKKDLALRKLRFEIIDKINADQWYFVLQHIPPVELKPRTTHCAHPYCVYHESDLMPAGVYRLVFMSVEQIGEPEHRFDDISDVAETPGRTEDDQMLFCLKCIEDLFNGIGLIKATDESMAEGVSKRSASGKTSAGFGKAAHPQPPNIEPMLMAPGLDVFAATLHTFIRPEIRYTWHEFYTLNSFEYQALMKWKNMCIRKTMWEIPSNRAFNLQVPGKAAEYDLVNFFGDDSLDMSEPRPSIVIGIALNMEEVDADDISTLQYQKPSGTDAVKKGRGGKRVPHPLSHVMNVDDISISELELSFGKSKFEKLNGGRTRVLHPLSEIMMLVDSRVQKAWAAMTPPYVPRRSIGAPDPPKRKWPPHDFWKSQFEKECEEQKEMDLQKVIEQNYETINRRMKALGLEDLVIVRPKMTQTPPSSYETNTRDMSPAPEEDSASDGSPPSRKNKKGRDGLCMTCGTTKSPEWRNGPHGHNTLCNACGIRYLRKRERRLVPPPKWGWDAR